jgi:hypothetical protein
MLLKRVYRIINRHSAMTQVSIVTAALSAVRVQLVQPDRQMTIFLA